MTDSPLISRQEAASSLGISVSTLRRMEARGTITPAASIGEGKKRYYSKAVFWSEVESVRAGQGSHHAGHPNKP